MSIAPSPLLFEPPAIDYTTSTKESMNFDLSTAMASVGVSVAVSPTATLVDLKDNTTITPSTPPVMLGTSIIQLLLDGSQLTAGRQYRLKIGWTPQGTSQVIILWARVNCLF